jgi:hypothetical protein
MLFPHTESNRIELRPASAADARLAYDILFRLGRSGLPLVDAYVETFGQGTSACFLVHRKDTEEVAGLATLSDLTPGGHVRAEISLSAGQPDEIRAHAAALVTNFAFAMWRTRKVYFHETEEGAAAVGFTGPHARMVRAEAILPDHVYFHGRLWDVYISAIYRDQWDIHGVDLLKQIV